MLVIKSMPVIILGVLSVGCLPGDAAVKVTGRFVDQHRRAYEECSLTVKYQDQIVEKSKISGAFLETIVFNPTSGDPLIFLASCAGAQGSYEKAIEEIPKDFSQPIDLGIVVLQRQ